jgi:Protein of unknown function (DUF998)
MTVDIQSTLNPRSDRPGCLTSRPLPGTLPAGPAFGATTLSPLGWVLVMCGTVGGLLFTAVYVIEGATRSGYDVWGQAISALSLGPGGWIQQVNFIVFGSLLIASALGWNQALSPGVSALAYPILRAVAGLGLIVDGVFSQDPAPGYPSGAVRTSSTLHGGIHTIAAAAVIVCLAASCFVLARRLKSEPNWHGWAVAATATGVLTIAFIGVFGAMGAHGGISGLFERLSGGVNSILGVAVVSRMVLLDGVRPSRKGKADQ